MTKVDNIMENLLERKQEIVKQIVAIDTVIEIFSRHQVQLLSTPIAESDLPVRIKNTCEDAGLINLGELYHIESRHFLKHRNIGVGSIADIRKFFKKHNLKYA